jgi:hypothetical protein
VFAWHTRGSGFDSPVLGKKKKFCFGHIEFERPMGHLSRNVEVESGVYREAKGGIIH